jgi:hypothetical protein
MLMISIDYMTSLLSYFIIPMMIISELSSYYLLSLIYLSTPLISLSSMSHLILVTYSHLYSHSSKHSHYILSH